VYTSVKFIYTVLA